MKDDWFWTEEWQAGERQADEDIANSRYQECQTVDELLEWLNSLK